jgi:DNA polymerase (family X)
MDNHVVANTLLDIAKIKKALNANKFSIGAYHKAASFVSHLTVPIETVDLENTKGIGPKIGQQIKELLDTGHVQFIVDNQHLLQSDQKFEELLKVEGIGEKTALVIYQKLHISTIAQLKQALIDGALTQIFKDKSIEKIRKGIEYLDTTRGRIRLEEAIVMANEIYLYMKPYVSQIEFCGSFRRSKETVGDVDFAIVANPGVDVLRKFEQMPNIDKVIDSGDKKSSVWVKGVRVDCYAFTPENFECGIMHLTGSDEHNKRLRERAITRGLILSQYGLYKRSDDDKREGPQLEGTEKGIYRALGLHWVPPEHREGDVEIDRYSLDKVPPVYLQATDITTDYHIHSTWSDGKSTIAQNVEMAIAKGLQSIAIVDHSQGLKIAHGLSVEDVLAKKQEIITLRSQYPNIKILMGSEVDIKSDGSLDYPDEILDQLDLVVAAIHTNTKQDVTEMYKTAIMSGKVHVIAHITGRLINERPGLTLNVEEVLQCCKQYNVAIELNCQPMRLDANESILKRCKELGVKVSLGSDAHEKNQISLVKTFGLWIARRAWLIKEDFLEL